MTERLKLRALDEEDLRIVSSVLQDAVIPASEMEYLAEERRFAFVASRFRWENCDRSRAECGAYERVNCGVLFDRVGAVRLRDIDLRDRAAVHELLAVEPADGVIALCFGGGGEVRLEVEGIVCHLQDIGEPWPTQWKPQHPGTDGT